MNQSSRWGELPGSGNDSDEIRRLRSRINNLISLQALPTFGAGNEASQVLSLLLDAQGGTLNLDRAYARAIDTTIAAQNPIGGGQLSIAPLRFGTQ